MNETKGFSSPYLIQRVKFRPTATGPTWDGVFTHDYMGSAEFEFGALPKSLKRLCKMADNLKITVFDDIKDIKKNPIAVLCNKDKNSEEYHEFLKEMTKGVTSIIHLKECTYLEYHVTGKGINGRNINPDEYTQVWWDIENDVIFAFSHQKVKKAYHAIVATRDKKKLEGEKEWY